MNKVHELALTPAQQIVPINGDMVNFQAHLSVVSKTKAPFLVLIVEEKQLVNMDEKTEFQRADDGVIDIDINNDKNKLEVWYIVLKAEQTNTVLLTIDLMHISPIATQDGQHEPVAPKKKINWKLVGIIVLIALLLIGGYIYFQSRASKPEVNTPLPLIVDELPVSEGPAVITPELDDDLIMRISQLPDL